MLDLASVVDEFEFFCASEVLTILEVKVDDEDPDRIRVGYKTDYGICHADFYRATGVYVGHENRDRPYRIRKKAGVAPQQVFTIRATQTGWTRDEFVEVTQVFDLETAKALVAEYNTKARATGSPFNFRMKGETIMSSVPNYKEWAEFRFESGEWIRASFDGSVEGIPPYHFPRISNENACMVTYWASVEDAVNERISRANCGSYLRSFTNLSDKEIEEWVHKFDPPGELVLSGKSPDDIYEAYQKAEREGGVHSCMSYSDTRRTTNGEPWVSGSPVRVYGGGDLEVIMLKRHGRIVARALCWPEKKIVGRLYGDIGRLRQALTSDGWTFDGSTGNDMHTEGDGGFNGARLLRIPVGEGNYVCPYIDFRYCVTIKKDHLVMDKSGDHYAHRTDGVLFDHDDEDMMVCPWCDERVHEDETSYVSEGHGTYVCTRCYEEYAVYCDERGCNTNMHSENAVITEDDVTLCRAHRHLAVTCEDCNTTYYRGEHECSAAVESLGEAA